MTFIKFCKVIGLTLTPAQAAIASVVFDGAPVPEGFEDLFKLPAGTVVPASVRRVLGMLCGRGSGKTAIGSAAVLWRLLYSKPKLGKGEIGFGLVVSPSIEMSTQALRAARGSIKDTPFESLIVAETKTSFDLRRPDGKLMRFAVVTAGHGGHPGRGRTVVAAMIDEVTFLRADGAAVSDADNFSSLMPRLVGGGFVLVASTPWTQDGLLFTLWKDNFGRADGSACVVVAPTERMRPDSQALLDTAAAEKIRDPINYEREFNCVWGLTTAGSLFDSVALADSVVDVDAQYDPMHGTAFLGGDVGIAVDPSAFVAVQYFGGKAIVVDVLEMKPGRGAPNDLKRVLTRASDFAVKHDRRPIRVDHHNFEIECQTIREHGLPLALEACSESPADRDERFQAAADLVARGDLIIPRRFAKLAEQLARFQQARRVGGGYTYSITRRGGDHGDIGAALLLALEQIIPLVNYQRFGTNMARHAGVAIALGGPNDEATPEAIEASLIGMYGGSVSAYMADALGVDEETMALARAEQARASEHHQTIHATRLAREAEALAARRPSLDR